MKFFAILFFFISVLGIYFIFFQGEKTEWIMPKELNEISGISFVDDHTLACVQDEKGIIFLYDLKKSEITKRIPFAKKGDYEGITIAGNTAFIVTGNGILYEVDNYMNTPIVNSFPLNLMPNEESEAVCYDSIANTLLLAFKNDDNPGLFTFDPTSKKLNDSAVTSIDFSTAAIRKKDRNKVKKLWQPADIAIDRFNNTLLVIDAINMNLKELSMDGKLLQFIPIDHKKIRHPEGIAVAPDGSIFICNDANNEGKGKILKFRNGNHY
jgi:uncharacterized protein YjiK